METTTTNIDYKAELDKALAIVQAQQLTIQQLQLEIRQLKKLVFGSRHERFMGADAQNASTLFDVTPIAELVTGITTTVTYEKKVNNYTPTIMAATVFPILCAEKNKSCTQKG